MPARRWAISLHCRKCRHILRLNADAQPAPRHIQGKPSSKPSTSEPTFVQRCSRGRRQGKCPHFLRLLARPKPIPNRLHISHALQRHPYQGDLSSAKAVTHLVIEVSEL